MNGPYKVEIRPYGIAMLNKENTEIIKYVLDDSCTVGADIEEVNSICEACNEYNYLIREIDKLHKQIEFEYQRGYQQGYNEGLLKGSENLITYMQNGPGTQYIVVTQEQYDKIAKEKKLV